MPLSNYLGSSASSQRSYSAPPEKGTLITAPISGWQASTSYVIDPTYSPYRNRVINGGNIYQCITAGTSAGTGGPSGTGSNITDGTVHWKYLGANQSQAVSVGSVIVAYVARGTQSTLPSGSAGISPYDNQGKTFITLQNKNYSGYADSFLGTFIRSGTISSATSSYQIVAQWGGTSVGSGAGDELTVGWGEFFNVNYTPITASQVERSSATSGIVTGPSVTNNNKNCLVISVWGGNGAVVTPGSSHTAIPLNGLQFVSGCNNLIAISSNGYIQCAMAWRYVTASNNFFAEQWQTGTGASEGAQLHTILLEDATDYGAASNTLGTLTSTAAGYQTHVGSVDRQLSAITLVAAGYETHLGVSANSLDTLTLSAAGAQTSVSTETELRYPYTKILTGIRLSPIINKKISRKP